MRFSDREIAIEAVVAVCTGEWGCVADIATEMTGWGRKLLNVKFISAGLGGARTGIDAFATCASCT